LRFLVRFSPRGHRGHGDRKAVLCTPCLRGETGFGLRAKAGFIEVS
jgi:hypothetical protein